MTEAFDSAADINDPDRQWEYTVDGYVDHAARAQRHALELVKQRIGKDNPEAEDWRFIVRKQSPTRPGYGT